MFLLAKQSHAKPPGLFDVAGQAVNIVTGGQYAVTISTPPMNNAQRTAAMVAIDESGQMNVSRMSAETVGNRTFFRIHFTAKQDQLLTVGDSIRVGGKLTTVHSIQIVGSGLLAAA